jgi:hypothetical protein
MFQIILSVTHTLASTATARPTVIVINQLVLFVQVIRAYAVQLRFGASLDVFLRRQLTRLVLAAIVITVCI